MSNIATAPTAVQTAAPQKSGYDGFSTEETHWGYIVRATCASGHRLIPSQSLSLLTGAALIAASIGMWLIPGLLVNGDALIMRMFATVTFLSAAENVTAGLLQLRFHRRRFHRTHRRRGCSLPAAALPQFRRNLRRRARPPSGIERIVRPDQQRRDGRRDRRRVKSQQRPRPRGLNNLRTPAFMT